MNNIPDKSIDAIITDLPYHVTQCHWNSLIPFNDYVMINNKIYYEKDIPQLCVKQNKPFKEVKTWFRDNKKVGLWTQYNRIIKDNGAILLFSSQPFTSALIMSNPKMYKYEWIWHKTHPKGHLNSKKMPMRAHENVEVFYKKPPTYNPQITHGHKRKVAKTNYIREADGDSCYGREVRNTSYDSTDRYPLDVQVFSNADQSNKIHQTQKPVEVYQYFMRTYTNEGEVVLDSTAGSMTCAIAGIEENRKVICIEKDKDIFKAGENRVIEYLRERGEG